MWLSHMIRFIIKSCFRNIQGYLSQNTIGMSAALWLNVDLRSKCEFLNTSHLLIEGYILEIDHVKTKLSLTIYLTTKKISATSERAQLHRSQKRARAAVFAY